MTQLLPLTVTMIVAGIKPCVSAFGGDQFVQSNEREVTSYFMAFYFSINFGSFFSYIITPLARYAGAAVEMPYFTVDFPVLHFIVMPGAM
jgi:dipeptide/tripeptide permease